MAPRTPQNHLQRLGAVGLYGGPAEKADRLSHTVIYSKQLFTCVLSSTHVSA